MKTRSKNGTRKHMNLIKERWTKGVWSYDGRGDGKVYRGREQEEYRQQKQARNTAARKRARQNPDFRERERARNSAARRKAREDSEYRGRERARDTAAHRRRREDPAFRQRERQRERERARQLKSRLLETQITTNTIIQKSIFLSSGRGTGTEKEEIQSAEFEGPTRKIADLKGLFEVCLSEETTLTFC